MPRDLWRCASQSNEIADLSTAAKLAEVDLPVARPGERLGRHFKP
jgi:hypothetical protein